MKQKRGHILWGIYLIGFLTIPVKAMDLENLPTPPKTSWEEMWKIQLINNENLITQEIDIEFASFDGQSVDARTAEDYAALCAKAKEDGITLYLRSGYRSIAIQRYLYEQGVQRYMSMGYSYTTAVSIANRYYAAAGGSEHNIALGFDIITPAYHAVTAVLSTDFANTTAYTWLLANCADYGFILRYPEGRTADTGINFEPWHYRYVGVEHAQYITEHNLILEEYVALYQMTYPELYADTPPEHDIPLTLLDPDLIITMEPEPEPEPTPYLDYFKESVFEMLERYYLSRLWW